MNYNKHHYYFDIARQVLYWDNESDRYFVGIAYHDSIISAHNGSTVTLAEVIDFAPTSVEPIRVFHVWIDCAYDIVEGFDDAESLKLWPNNCFEDLDVYCTDYVKLKR